MTTGSSDFLEEELIRTETLLAERTRQYQDTLEKLSVLERLTSQGAQLAGHIAYLTTTLPERSTDIEQAAAQLHNLLTSRPEV